MGAACLGGGPEGEEIAKVGEHQTWPKACVSNQKAASKTCGRPLFPTGSQGRDLAASANHHEGRDVVSEADRCRVAVFIVASATAIAIAIIIGRFRRGLLAALRAGTGV